MKENYALLNIEKNYIHIIFIQHESNDS